MDSELDPVGGLHHVTAVAGDPVANRTFYTETLGLRLVKRTVNFDDPTTHHLYYGDERGTPGTTITFFAVPQGRRARSGVGETSAVAFAVPDGSLGYWRDRLTDAGADVRGVTERFGEHVLPVADPDGVELELVETRDTPDVNAADTTDADGSDATDADGSNGTDADGSDATDGNTDADDTTRDDANEVRPWTAAVPADRAIRGFDGVTLRLSGIERTANVLETLGFQRGETVGDRTRLTIPGERARTVDLVDRPDGTRGGGGVGSVHHVAFRVPDTETQDGYRQRLIDAGHRVTEPKDRRYFRSIYVREPGGVLFEIATDGPGFDRDESPAELGSSLQLPPWLEADRDRIEAELPPLSADVPADD